MKKKTDEEIILSVSDAPAEESAGGNGREPVEEVNESSATDAVCPSNGEKKKEEKRGKEKHKKKGVCGGRPEQSSDCSEREVKSEERTEIGTEKKGSSRLTKTKKFFKRYWYWFAVIALLIGGVIGWCAGMGYINGESEFELKHGVITLTPFSYYKLDGYAGRQEITYEVPSEYSDILSIEGNLIFAKQTGKAKVIAFAGDQSIRITVNVEPYALFWTVGIDEEIYESDILALCASITEVNGVANSNVEVLETIPPEDGGVTTYKAKKEGISVLSVISNGVEVCGITVYVKETLGAGERHVDSDIEILTGTSVFYEKLNIVESKSLKLSDAYSMKSPTFNGDGYVFFESSNKRVAFIRQNGDVVPYLPGTVILTAVCMKLDGSDLEYYSVKLTFTEDIVPARRQYEDSAWTDLYVGDFLPESDLRSIYNRAEIVMFEVTNTDYVSVTVDENGAYGFTMLQLTEGRDVFIDGYTYDGKRVVRYKVEIVEMAVDEELDKK